MGKIIINVPLNIEKEFTVTSSNAIDEILSLVQKSIPHQPSHPFSLAGIWEDRFTNQSGQDIQRKWRKELWERS